MTAIVAMLVACASAWGGSGIQLPPMKEVFQEGMDATSRALALEFNKLLDEAEAPAALKRYCTQGGDVWWLHIPKNGLSFHVSVTMCEYDESRPHIFHPPLQLGRDNFHNVVSVFRDPAQRLASQFTYLAEGLETSHEGRQCLGWGCNSTTRNKIWELLKKGHTPATDDFLGNRFLGCQTNMITGHECMHGPPKDLQKTAKEAMARMDQFKFVGLLEEWTLSTCLYNYKVSGRRFVTYEQLRNTHPTQTKDTSSGYDYDVSGYPRDEADEMVYQHAVELFNGEIKLHGISLDACSFSEEGKPIETLENGTKHERRLYCAWYPSRC